MTRPVAIAIAVFWLALFLAGSARADAPIRLWHSYRGAEEQALVEIVAAQPQAVEVLAIPYDAFASKISAAIPLGEGPDLFIDSHERLGDYRRRGIVAAVGDAYDPAAFASAVHEAVQQTGEPWAVPLSQKSLALYMNLALVAEVPRDVESIAELAGRLPEGTWALVYEAQNAYAHAAFLHAFGGAFLDGEDRFAFVGPQAERSLEYAVALLDAGVVPRDADGALVTNLFRGGRAAFAISGPWLTADLEGEVDYRVVPLPLVRATGQRMRPMLTVEAVMLSPRGAARPEVRALARHLAGRDAAATRMRRAGVLSARRDFDVSVDPTLAAFAEQAAHALPMPSSPAMRAVWEPSSRALRKVVRGEATPAAALEEAEHRFRDVRRPPPPPASPVPALALVGFAAMWGAFVLVRRARDPATRARLRHALPVYGWVAHAVVAVGVLVVFPLVVGAATSLFAGPAGEMHYVGWANFVEILRARGGSLVSTGSFWFVLAVTILWTVVNVAGHLAIGVALGVLLARPLLRMRAIYRVLLIIPWAVPNYVTALAWKGMFHRQFGAVTGLLLAIEEHLGVAIEPISWFARFSTAFTANVATNVWLGFPFMMVVTVGALTGVPKDVLEAADVDGATRWQRLRHVTLPMIAPSLLPAVVLGAIWTFNMFNVVFLVSGGDPDGTTDILVSDAYRWAFTREAQYGYAAAYAVLIFGLLAGATRLLGRASATRKG